MFQSNLRGMETSLETQHLQQPVLFQSNLRGMETWFSCLLKIEVDPGFNRTLEGWKPRTEKIASATKNGFQSNLRGMETIFKHYRTNGHCTFQSNLRGMETVNSTSPPIAGWLGFNRTLEYQNLFFLNIDFLENRGII